MKHIVYSLYRFDMFANMGMWQLFFLKYLITHMTILDEF